ncbi:PH domain-containing protein [Holzapfeliella floricola]|uniref:PH domain-containing protein n=1 Tax=Holzapfeliella floricola TaxID=679249 RepID=UPI00078436EB|nr:hypothetical protein [Holzapfeliella floricola]
MNYQLLTQKKCLAELKKAWFISDIVEAIISLIVVGTVGNIFPIPYKEWVMPIVLIAIVAFFVGSLVLIPYRYHFHRYQIDGDAISFQRGVFFRKNRLCAA